MKFCRLIGGESASLSLQVYVVRVATSSCQKVAAEIARFSDKSRNVVVVGAGIELVQWAINLVT